MALIECGECKQLISDSAYFCPKCGCVRKSIWLEKSQKVYQMYSILMGLVSAIFFIVSLNSRLSSSTREVVDASKYAFLGFSVLGLIVGWVTSKLDLKSK